MDLNADRCYRALTTRDSRFDGRFFVGVVSTGIYCRPICPAPTPRRRNVRFFECAAAAAASGLRPCLRCRPESAPGTAAWRGSSAIVTRSLRLIDEGALDAASVGELALRVGVGERQLRRLFVEHVGASPATVAQTRRIHFAKRLLDETDLPMTEVALAAGFASLRRFNDAMAGCYGRPPSALRAMHRRGKAQRDGASLRLRLAYRRPFAWKRIAEYLRGRAIPGVEEIDAKAYRRSVHLGERPAWIEVRPMPGRDELSLEVRGGSSLHLIDAAHRVRRLFDLDADPRAIARELARDRWLATRVKLRRGVRVPGCWDGFELAVRAILGQQVSVPRATELSGWMVDKFGERLAHPSGSILSTFPRPEVLAEQDLAAQGWMPGVRARAIRLVARAVADGDLLLDPPAEPERTREQLLAIPGIGPWTADYVALRALRDPDAFPNADLGLRKAAGEPGAPMSASELARRSEAWRPWRSYAALALWSTDEAAAPPPSRRRGKGG